MAILDKNNVLANVRGLAHVELELGCGDRKRIPGAVGIDVLDSNSADIVGDIFEVLMKFPDSSVDAVYAFHFIEHIEDIHKLLVEIGRIVKQGGRVLFVAPHFTNPYFYSDYTHKSFFGLYTFCYLCESTLFRREVPKYQIKPVFRLVNVELVFKSARPFYFRYILRRFFGLFANSFAYTKEFYEENLCYLVPCYEIRYELIKI